ncbi:MAG: hypothetical protein Q7S47_01660 [bacterium]|nr:hypothetical protein [bacterium]
MVTNAVEDDVLGRIRRMWDNCPLSSASAVRREERQAEALIEKHFGEGVSELGGRLATSFNSIKAFESLDRERERLIVEAIQVFASEERILVPLSLGREKDIVSFRNYLDCLNGFTPFDAFLTRVPIRKICGSFVSSDEYALMVRHLLRHRHTANWSWMVNRVLQVTDVNAEIASEFLSTLRRSHRKLTELLVMASISGQQPIVDAATTLRQAFESGTPVLGFKSRGSIAVLTK